MKFSSYEIINAILMHGLNAGTHKPALFQSFEKFYKNSKSLIDWHYDLSDSYFNIYEKRFKKDRKPQQGFIHRQTVQERTFDLLDAGKITRDEALHIIGKDGFNDVIKRFHSFGTDNTTFKNYFFEVVDFGKKLVLKDTLFEISKLDFDELLLQAKIKQTTLEGSYLIKHNTDEDFRFANDKRKTYLQSLKNIEKRIDLTKQREFLVPYQSNKCFYCNQFLSLSRETPAVDHVIPYKWVLHNQEWNLVAGHKYCNDQKNEFLVGPHYIEALFLRNENIVGNRYLWKDKIIKHLGSSKLKRKKQLFFEYNKIKDQMTYNKKVLWWNGDKNYDLRNNPEYKSLLTRLNN